MKVFTGLVSKLGFNDPAALEGSDGLVVFTSMWHYDYGSCLMFGEIWLRSFTQLLDKDQEI